MNIQRLRDICLSFPSVTEDVKWEHDLCMLIGGKMFCVMPLEGEFKASFKVPEQEFEELCMIEGVIPAPYMARNHWIQVRDPDVFHAEEWQRRVMTSYHLVATRLSKKLQRELGIES